MNNCTVSGTNSILEYFNQQTDENMQYAYKLISTVQFKAIGIMHIWISQHCEDVETILASAIVSETLEELIEEFFELTQIKKDYIDINDLTLSAYSVLTNVFYKHFNFYPTNYFNLFYEAVLNSLKQTKDGDLSEDYIHDIIDDFNVIVLTNYMRILSEYYDIQLELINEEEFTSKQIEQFAHKLYFLKNMFIILNYVPVPDTFNVGEVDVNKYIKHAIRTFKQDLYKKSIDDKLVMLYSMVAVEECKQLC